MTSRGAFLPASLSTPSVLLPLRLPTFVLSCCLLLLSCDGGYLTSGTDEGLCDTVAGTWEGAAENGVMTFSLSQDDKCDLRGAAVYQPCVPVTAVEGYAGLIGGNYFGWSATTIDGSLSVKNLRFPSLEDLGLATSTKMAGVGAQVEKEYVFTNTQNHPNCPQSETGRIIFTKTS